MKIKNMIIGCILFACSSFDARHRQDIRNELSFDLRQKIELMSPAEFLDWASDMGTNIRELATLYPDQSQIARRYLMQARAKMERHPQLLNMFTPQLKKLFNYPLSQAELAELASPSKQPETRMFDNQTQESMPSAQEIVVEEEKEEELLPPKELVTQEEIILPDEQPVHTPETMIEKKEEEKPVFTQEKSQELPLLADDEENARRDLRDDIFDISNALENIKETETNEIISLIKELNEKIEQYTRLGGSAKDFATVISDAQMLVQEAFEDIFVDAAANNLGGVPTSQQLAAANALLKTYVASGGDSDVILKTIKYVQSVTINFNPQTKEVSLSINQSFNAAPGQRIYATIKRSDFFAAVMGIPEDQFVVRWKNDPRQFLASAPGNEIMLNGTYQGKPVLYKAGSFSPLAIGALQSQTQSIAKGGGRFNVIAGKGMATKNKNMIDVGALQAHPDNKDAVFQVASNFSALEPVSKSDYPTTISKYIFDPTQGPFASISAAPGLIYRMYYIFKNKFPDKPLEWRQTQNSQINLLGNVPEAFPVVNGYIDFTGDNIKKLDTWERSKEITYRMIQVGYHRGIQVTSGLAEGNEQKQFYDPTQIIDQVFTAAIDFGDASGSYNRLHRDQLVSNGKAQMILDAAYEGTLRAAAVWRRNKVFLTMIGGGVFNNDPLWIAAAIKKNKELIQNAGLDVYLVLYDETKVNDAFKNEMKELVNQTDGRYIAVD